ncbi:MAG: VF530 family DNA-binding protein [Bacteroidales bacterium]
MQLYSMIMSEHISNDPLHGKTLKFILETLVEQYGWEEMARRIRINCFAKDPSINSSLTFLRKTPWARQKVEQLYIQTLSKK